MGNKLNNLAQFDKFTIDTEKKILWYDDKAVELPLKAIELLSLLVENSGELVTKERIFDTVWRDSFVEESVLTQNIYRLRKLFKKHGIKDELIKNVPRRGYRFLGGIAEIVEEEFFIERSVVEKTLVAEIEIEDHQEIIAPDSFPSGQTKQLPGQPSKFFSQKKNYAYAGLILLLSFSVIGAGFWFGRSPTSTSRTAGLMTDNIELERLTSSGKAFMPAISRDGSLLAFVHTENNTYSVILKHLPTKSETVVVEPEDYEIRSLNFSADGNYVFYITREKENPESTIYQIPLYGGPKRKIITNVRHYFSISPDGEQLAFFRYDAEKDETSLMTCRIDGGDERVVASRKSPYFFQVWETFPAWSPDGKKLVVSGYDRVKEEKDDNLTVYLLEIDIETGIETPVKHPDWRTAFQAFWLTDGSGLIVTAAEDLGSSAQIWHLSYPEGWATRITNDTNNYDDLRLSFDSKSILVTNKLGHSNLFLVPLDHPGNTEKLTSQTLGNFGMWGIDWTDDGKQLVYVKSEGRRDGNLWKIDIETKETQQLTFEENVADRFPKITPDGKSVLFSSNRSEKRHIWQIDLDGKNLRQITDTTQGETYPEISEDGKWLFYTLIKTGNFEVWRKPLAGGEAVRILEYAGGVSKVSPTDSDRIIAHYFDPFEKDKSPWKYILFSHEAKNELRPLDFYPHNHSFEWKKDGTGIFFANSTVNQNNLWFYSIADNKSERITDFEDQKIVNLSVSPDDKTIAIARGATTGNILKISGF